MKDKLKISLLIVFLFIEYSGAPAQNIGINSTGAAPDNSAMLDISASNKGLLIPRVFLNSTSDAVTIPNPATSLLVWNINSSIGGGTGFYYNAGSVVTPVWTKLITAGELSDDWSLTGNSGTVDGTHFIGTTDGSPLNFRVNNQKSGRIDSIRANTSIGYRSLDVNTGIGNSAFGMYSLLNNTTGSNNSANGYTALRHNTTGTNNTANGDGALYSNNTGNNNTATGRYSLFSNGSGNNNTALGYNAGVIFSNLTNATAIGYNAQVSMSNSLVLGDTTNVNVGIGTGAPTAKLDIVGQVRIRGGAPGGGKVLTSDASGVATWETPITGGGTLNEAYNFGGAGAGRVISANTGAVEINKTTQRQANLTISGQEYVTPSGNAASGIAIMAGVNRNNNKQLWITDQDAVTTPNATSAVVRIMPSRSLGVGVIDAIATDGSTLLPLILQGGGNRVGIGTSTPTQSLDINGQIRIRGGVPGAGKVLTSDADGVASWQNLTLANYWSLTGNSGTMDGTHFIGTTDNVPLNFRVNNQKAGRIDTTGRNTSLGYRSLETNTGTANSAFGMNALRNNTTGNNNTAIGAESLYSNRAGYRAVAIGSGAMYYANSTATSFDSRNTAIGYEALRGSTNAVNNTGYNNTVVGYQSMWENTTGYANSAIGERTLWANRTGYSNTALGQGALWNNNSGYENTVVGRDALMRNMDGNLNTAVGFETLHNNVAGSHATAIGSRAMYYTSSRVTAFENYNVAVGYEALRGSTNAAINIGNNNTATGYQSLFSNRSGNDNAVYGYQALYQNTSGYNNMAYGSQVLYQNTSGYNNIACGFQALYQNTVGNNNTAIGVEALYSNRAVSRTIAIGYRAMYYANSRITSFDSKNIAIGYEALRGSANAANNTGYNNIAVGYQSMFNTTTGYANTAMGESALYANTTGYRNTAIGSGTLWQNTEGYQNTAIGRGALLRNTMGNNNTAIGVEALVENTIGNQNTAVGMHALLRNIRGSGATAIGDSAMCYANNTLTAFINQNVAIGKGALRGSNNPSINTGNANTAVGFRSLQNNSSGGMNVTLGTNTLVSNTLGGQNTAIGYQALLGNTIGSNNVALGSSAGDALVTGDNNVMIGYNAQASAINASNEVTIGNNAHNVYRMFAASWTNASDRRLKHNIQPLKPGLDFVMRLQPVEYVYNNSDTERKTIGFIAQDVQSNLQAHQMEGYNLVSQLDEKYLGLNTTELIGVLTKAIQEQQQIINTLGAELSTQKTHNSDLEKRLIKLEMMKE